MKKNTMIVLSILLTILGSCVTNKGIYPKNSTVSAKQRCTLTIKQGVTVIAFDAQFVRWNDPLRDWSKSATRVSIEPGLHTLAFFSPDLHRRIIDRYPENSDKEIWVYAEKAKLIQTGMEINFLPGHDYVISKVANAVGGSFLDDEVIQLGLQMWDKTAKEWVFRIF